MLSHDFKVVKIIKLFLADIHGKLESLYKYYYSARAQVVNKKLSKLWKWMRDCDG